MSEIKKNSVILITGAAGFVGSHLCEFYLNQGIKVIGIDNFDTGTHENLKALKEFDNFLFFEQDITDTSIIESFDMKFDYLFNFASPASPIDFDRLSIEIMKVNSIGTENMIKLAMKNKARFLQASTSEVYGDPEVHPQVEEYKGCVNTTGPRACYDESKRFAEALITSYSTKYPELESRIVRIFNTYGPRMRANDGRVVPNFIDQALKGEDITIYGDGKQTRSFCYVDDLVRAIDLVMRGDDPTPFNIGNDGEFTVHELAKIITEIIETKSKIDFFPIGADDPKRRRPDLTKIHSKFGYRPKVSLNDGLVKTVEYFQSIND